MTVEVVDQVVRIRGNAEVADAEPILAALDDDPSRTIDLSEAGHLHSAVVQLLLALRPKIVGTPAYPVFVTYVLPLIAADPGTA